MTNDRTAQRALPGKAALIGFAVVAALAATAAPLIAYAGSLALFGLPHVLAELRYVDGRFGRRIGKAQGATILILIGLAVCLRGFAQSGRVNPIDAVAAELGLVAVLAFIAVPALAASPWRAAIALLFGASLAFGSAVAPFTTLVLLAVLHNLTPVGFLFERFGRSPLQRSLVVATGILFVLVPLAIATGLPAHLLHAVGLLAPEATFGSVGDLTVHRGVFVPARLFSDQTSTHVFAAVTYLQLLHYGAVLLVLPRLLTVTPVSGKPVAGHRTVLPWPRRTVLIGLIAAVGLVAAIAFFRDFHGTRASYGLIAAVHAWIEIPLLLLALAPPREAAGETQLAPSP